MKVYWKEVSLVLAILATLAILPALILGALSAQTPPALPKVEEVIHKAVQRAQWTGAQHFERQYVWTRHSVTEELDGDGAVKKRNDRVFQIIPLAEGVRLGRLIQKDGRPLTDLEQKEQQEREKQARLDAAQKKRPPAPRRPNQEDVLFNQEMADKYNFQLLGREQVNGRPAFLLTFQPKSNDLPVRRTVDRLLNKLAGKVWIDEREYEIARAEARLTGSVTMWGGLAASFTKSDVFFEQARMEDGAWLVQRVDSVVDGRALVFKALHFRVSERRSDFHRITPEMTAETYFHQDMPPKK